MLKKLNKSFKLKSFKILILGFTFKENCNDIRNSKVIDLIKFLEKKIKYMYLIHMLKSTI